jgi:hypothetical protein
MSVLKLRRSLQELVDLFGAATFLFGFSVLDFLDIRSTANQNYYQRLEYYSAITSDLVALGVISTPIKLSIGRRFLSSFEAPAERTYPPSLQ